MKVCVPTMEKGGLDDSVSGHFGRAPTFTIVDIETNDVKVLKNDGEHFGGHGGATSNVIRSGATVVVCGGLGPGAIHLLTTSGIKVYSGATGTARDALKMWKEGALPVADADNACKDHRHEHGHEGDHGCNCHH